MGAIASLVRSALAGAAASLSSLRTVWTAGGGISWGGSYVTADKALRTSAVWRCFSILTGIYGALPLKVYQELPDGSRRTAPEHPNTPLLGWRPNRWQTAFQFREMLTGHRVLRGTGFAQIVRDQAGRPLEFIPLHPDRVRPLVNDDGEVLGWEYDQNQYATAIRKVRIFREDMLRFTGPSLDGWLALDTTSYARNAVALSQSAEEYASRVYSSAGLQRGALVKKDGGSLTTDAAAKLRSDWTAAYGGGGENMGKVAVLEYGLEWQSIGVTPEQAQGIQSRSHQVAEIARYFGVPLWMLFETGKDTSWGSGLEQTNLAFLIYTLWPGLTNLEQRLLLDLFSPAEIAAGYYAEFTVAALLKTDSAAQSAFLSKMMEIGLYSRNDVARIMNEPFISDDAGGNLHFRPANWVPLNAPPPLPGAASQRPGTEQPK